MPAARRDVRGTVWFGRTRPPAVSTQHAAMCTTSDYVPSNQAFIRATPGLNCLPPQHSTPNPAPREILARSPWEIYEACSAINYGRTMMQAVERSTIEIYVRMIDRLAHCRSPRLLSVFQYAEQYLLVQVIMRHIPEREEAQNLWPERAAPQCLRFLRDESGELEGELKIAGALKSTFKALRLIVHEIVEEHGSGFSWSSELRAFKSALARSTSGQCLDDIMRRRISKHAFFEQVAGAGGLKLLVELVKGTVFHEVIVRREGAFSRAGARGKPLRPSTT
ncbi:hypothetical protein BDQ94DRAFT_180012 [Aspergillus welwitschiae]|uniref:Uncharacterized protein n=1 Tax=Aspergillus welwitschiae TaxID=1341132 RepID=A0A3F3PH29_9EURO|nr:hypothetical protein BDQ94DRAFT_180012 [Aspergillus welwitschiae]RDH26179.1 hypothetical protein BDQ94DRAFT_180012 [Aspergillus welwitschiae]